LASGRWDCCQAADTGIAEAVAAKRIQNEDSERLAGREL
jgi:hypothetical protein